MNSAESKYIDKKAFRSRYASPSVAAQSAVPADEMPLCPIHEDLLKFLPFLTRRCGLQFFGRILEIGAGVAWLSAELSRLPKVVEVIATDFSPGPLKDHAPKVFQSLKANPAKITRTPGDFHQLDFPDNHFDFVVCSAALHQAVNMVQALREVKRVLKPGGHFVAIREPIKGLVKRSSRSKKHKEAAFGGPEQEVYTLDHYQELFKQASLPLTVKRVNFSSGFRYYIDKVVNHLTQARYAFIGRKHGSSPVRKNKPTTLSAQGLWIKSRTRPGRPARTGSKD